MAITYSSAFAQDINPVIGMTRFLFSIFDRMTIRKTRDGSFKLSSLCKGGDYLLFRFRSTIGVMRFNFSVRDGKRWNPHAVFTLISLFFGSLFPEPFFRPWPALRPYGVVGETGTYRSCRLPSRLSGRKLSSVVPTSRLRHGVFCFFSYGTFGQLVPLG